jgi:glycine/D-amino acid oxidase-like deaminating enzyme/nitrite reductase/ring-hydroxylating ferredoxin subunit
MEPDNQFSTTSGYHDSYWTDSSAGLAVGSLNSSMETDVVIVGGGIAGVSVAYALAKAGLKVILLEDGKIGSGESGRTTAHLVNAIDDRYTEIEKTWGRDVSKLVAESHTAAIDFIEDAIRNEGIACDFQRVDGYLFLHPSDRIKTLRDEFEASRNAGLNTELLPEIPGMSHREGMALRFPNQARFHPMKYLTSLAQAVIDLGGQIFQYTHVTEVDKTGVEVNGLKVSAKHVVVATNSPINNRVTMHTKQFAYRTYVLAAEVPKGSVPDALWWDTGNVDAKWVTKPYHYVRIHPFNDTSDLLIIGGEDHKTGQADAEEIKEEERYDLLEQWTRDRFPMITNIAYTWSGQVLEPVDMLAFIGRNPGDENIYIVTGDSGNGMTHGTIAAMLIRDLINGVGNPWEKIYDPSRITLSTGIDYLREVGNMTSQYADFVTPGDIDSLNLLSREEGAIIRSGLKKVAVYKDENNVIHAFSAVCPHLGCYVHWNADEKSFDCPCHGSRFSCEGKVINGPALTDLTPLSMEKMNRLVGREDDNR